jgi:hypothetical protein
MPFFQIVKKLNNFLKEKVSTVDKVLDEFFISSNREVTRTRNQGGLKWV